MTTSKHQAHTARCNIRASHQSTKCDITWRGSPAMMSFDKSMSLNMPSDFVVNWAPHSALSLEILRQPSNSSTGSVPASASTLQSQLPECAMHHTAELAKQHVCTIIGMLAVGHSKDVKARPAHLHQACTHMDFSASMLALLPSSRRLARSFL